MRASPKVFLAALLLLGGCAPPAVLSQPVARPEMAAPVAGGAVPVLRLAEPTGAPPISLPNRPNRAPHGGSMPELVP
ncbi:hypothetical protein J8J14_03895 [Roseomonas sp. SSH11]|uniref:Uncharacterized protein n=1 Tax=Pararoseomonas baculiformis TaxID=2820812 RepID=A0ABS4AA75_9PROT|nr:hypothetical protein [Pararoseomonas baculiformis]MBP0443914.1 hypothetical protein [Pararoseomonas baculiformis]